MHHAPYRRTDWDLALGNDTKVKYLNVPEVGDREQFEMTIRRRETADPVARHRHKIDQLRYTLPGPPTAWSPVDATPVGSVLYIAAGTFYGPYERAANEEYFSVKFGGSEDKPEDKRRPFPKSRFSAPVELHPSHFTWSWAVDGVRRKELASFGERRTVLSMVALGPDASTPLGPARTLLGFVTEGGGKAGSAELERFDAVTLEAGEHLDLSAGAVGLELLLLELPEPIADSAGN